MVGVAGERLLARLIVDHPDLSGRRDIDAVYEATHRYTIGQHGVDVHFCGVGVEALGVFHLEVATQEASAFHQKIVEFLLWYQLEEIFVLSAHVGPGGFELFDGGGVEALLAWQLMHFL